MIHIFIIPGIIIILITMILGTNNPNTLFGVNVGLALILLGVLTYLVNRWNDIYTVKNIFELIIDLFPYLLMILSILGTIYIIGKYFKKISSDTVSDSFKIFKNMFLILTILQVTSIIYYYSKPSDKKTTDYLIYILGIFNFVFLIIMYTSLTYFSTDGFRNITSSIGYQ
jgi:hypothetical protein